MANDAACRVASDGRECVNALLEHHGVMSVGATEQHHQWDASRVYDDVPLGA